MKAPIKNRIRRKLGESLVLFSLPAVLLYTIFFTYPTFSGILYAFTNWDGITPKYKITFFENFLRLTQVQDFGIGVINTFIYSICYLVFINVISILLALAVTSIKKIKNIIKTTIFIPVMMSTVVVAYVWQSMFRYEDGVINVFLSTIGLGLLKSEWLGNESIAIYALIMVGIWQTIGYYLVIYATGIENIPSELYEAADIDGASFWQKFTKVTFPMLAPVFTICTVLSTINGFKTFDLPYILTRGGPGNATQSITTLVFDYAFGRNDFGLACAYSILLLVFISLISLVQAQILRKREVHL